MRTRWYGVASQRDGFDVLNCLNGNTHRLTLLDLRSDTGNPNSIGFIRALLSAGYCERRRWHWGPNAFISRRLISRLNGKQPGWVFSHSGRTSCQFLSLASTSFAGGAYENESSGRNPSFGIGPALLHVSPQATHRIVGVRSGAFPIAVALGRFQTGAQVLVAAPV